jgi:hypothetical protein
MPNGAEKGAAHGHTRRKKPRATPPQTVVVKCDMRY